GRRFPASDLRFAASSNGGHTFTSTRTVNDDAGGLPSSHTFHDMVVAPDGTIVVSWIDSRDPDRAAAAAAAGKPLSSLADTTSDIRVAISGDGGKSCSPGIIVDENPCPCCRVSVAVGADGMVYVAWRKLFAGDVRDVVVARAKLPGLLFEKPVRVHEDDWIFPGCPHAGPSIAVDDANRLHVAWYTGREDRQGLWYTSSDDGA